MRCIEISYNNLRTCYVFWPQIEIYVRVRATCACVQTKSFVYRICHAVCACANLQYILYRFATEPKTKLLYVQLIFDGKYSQIPAIVLMERCLLSFLFCRPVVDRIKMKLNDVKQRRKSRSTFDRTDKQSSNEIK